MHILLIHQAFAALNEPGGTRHHELARYLAAKGHTVSIIASPVSYLTGTTQNKRVPWLEKVESDDVNIHLYRSYTYQKLHKSFFHRLISFFSFMISSFFAGIKIKNVDLVWGTSPPLFQAPSAWALAKLKRAPFLLEIRDLWPLFAIEVGVLKNPILISMSRWLERFLYRQADTVVVNSPGYIDHVSVRGASKVALVPNGSDPGLFSGEYDRKEYRKRNGLGEAFLVLYAGAHGVSNDLGMVLGAAELLKNETDIHFVFVGDGKEKKNLIREAEQKQLANVSFLDSIAKNEIAEVFAAVDACVAILKRIDVYKTTYPNKVFDAMAAGKPVLLAIDGVVREVVETAEAGLFIEPGNSQMMAEKVQFLYLHPEICKKMGENGKAAINKSFHRRAQAEKMEALMMELKNK